MNIKEIIIHDLDSWVKTTYYSLSHCLEQVADYEKKMINYMAVNNIRLVTMGKTIYQIKAGADRP